MSENKDAKKPDCYTDNPDDLYKEEQEYILRRRQNNGISTSSNTSETWGICFSGGGIRSATLCLGIMQKFMRENIFRFFDYLSTVSGGGYIGCCLTSLLSKSPEKVLHNSFDHTKTGVCPEQSPFVGLNEYDENNERTSYKYDDQARLGVRNQMHHLRTHGEYLIPQRKLLSMDIQRFFGAIFAGLLHHLVIFITLLIALTAMIHFLLFFITAYPEDALVNRDFDKVPFLKELNYSSKNYYKITERTMENLTAESFKDYMVVPLRDMTNKVFYNGERDFILELKKLSFKTEKEQNKYDETEISAIVKYATVKDDTAVDYLKNNLKTWWYSRIAAPLNKMFIEGLKNHKVIYLGVFLFGMFFNFIAYKRMSCCIESIFSREESKINEIDSGFNIEDYYQKKFIKYYNLISMLVIFLIIICFGIYNSLKGESYDNPLWVMFLPLSLSVGMGYMSVAKNNFGKKYATARDYTVRSLFDCVSGASLYCIILSLVIPIGIVFLFSLNYFDLHFWWALISLTLSYFLFQGTEKGGKLKKLIFKYKKIMFTVLILIFISLWFDYISGSLLMNIYPDNNIPVIGQLNSIPLIMKPLIISILALIFVCGAGFIVNSNRVSPHYFYRDRLSDAYLKTDARVKRKGEGSKFQGMPLINLRNHEGLKLSEMGDGNERGPYHILVTALNLHGSDELNRKQMLSEHFIFSKYYVGSKVTGFVKSRAYRNDETRLARVMTISAAAVGSAMGQYTFGAESFAMTLFNIRLGYWMANPWYYYKKGSGFREPKHPFWLKWLYLELFGKMDARRRMVNLSDGGHTGDNLGLMPLLERRCKVIVVCDAEADNNYTFESFNNAVRMIYIEEKIQVNIDLSPIIPKKKEDGSLELSRKSVAVGEIIYPPKMKGEQETKGTLIYIKSSLSVRRGCEHLPVHVKNYRAEHQYFPHQNTTDQFFDDAQFEAYRALGEHICEQAIKEMEEEQIIKKHNNNWEAYFNQVES